MIGLHALGRRGMRINNNRVDEGGKVLDGAVRSIYGVLERWAEGNGG